MTAPTYASYSTLSELYRIRYRETGAEKQALMARHTLYGKIKRSPNLTGQIIAWPIQYDTATGYARGNDGLSQLLDPVHSQVGQNKYKAWSLSLEREYAAGWFDNVAKKQMANDQGAYKRLVDDEMRGIKSRFGWSLGHSMYRDGTGVMGVVASAALTLGVGTITLTKRTDTKYFSVGMKVNAINPASPATVAGGTYDVSYFEVVKRNLNKGTLDVTRVGSNAVDSTTTGWFLSPKGFYSQNGVNRIRGLDAICPLTDPTSTPFYGVDRTVDPNHLAGWRFDGASTTPLEDQIIEMSTRMGGNGAPGSMWVMANPVQVQAVLNRAQGRLQYETESMQGGEYAYGYKYVTVQSSEGDIRVYSDPDCPEDRWWGGNQDSISLGTLGDEPEVIDTAGSTEVRQPGVDGVRVELRVLAQVMPDNPRTLVTGQLT